MFRIIQTEFLKLKRFHILLIGLIGMTLPAILSVFTQAVATPETVTGNFVFSSLFSSAIWNGTTIFMPVVFTLIGGYLINREYTDNTLKSILPIPISMKHLLCGKLLTMGILSVLFGIYSYAVTLVVGLICGIAGLNATVLFTRFFQMIGAAVFTYIAILPIIAFTSRKPGRYLGGVIAAFLFGYSAMFMKQVTLRSLYPILAGLTVMGFDTRTFMNTSESGNLFLSILALAFMLLLAAIIVLLVKLPEEAFGRKKRKPTGIFLRAGQKDR